MRVFIYEYATGGGSLARDEPLPGSILTEGQAMLAALVADFQALAGVEVAVLRNTRCADNRRTPSPCPLPRSGGEGTGIGSMILGPCHVFDVASPAEEQNTFRRLAGQSDWSVVIAPEFDGLLLERACWVEGAGGRLLGPSPSVIALAADKHRTAEHLDAAGVPVPQGRVLDPYDPLPTEFPYPAVVKPIDGAGSVGVELLTCAADGVAASAKRRRLEKFCAGWPASASVLCGPCRIVPLPPCRQILSQDGRFQYQGGSYPLEESSASRATELALRACRSLDGARGYLGVDLVLGDEADGSADVVVEINPRLTTSYIGLRAATADNLARAMLAAATGEAVAITFRSTPIQFVPGGKPLPQDEPSGRELRCHSEGALATEESVRPARDP